MGVVAALPTAERGRRRRQWHRAALFVPIATFVGFYWLPWNPIFPAIVTMAAASVATALCRPDLARIKLTFLGGTGTVTGSKCLVTEWNA